MCVCVACGPAAYIIDTVGLAILPSSTVQSGTPVSIHCQVSVSHDNIPHLTHIFQLRRDDVPIYSSSTSEDSVTYELSPARAADSGNYDCRVTVKDKSKNSFGQRLDVTGEAVNGDDTLERHISQTRVFSVVRIGIASLARVVSYNRKNSASYPLYILFYILFLNQGLRLI